MQSNNTDVPPLIRLVEVSKTFQLPGGGTFQALRSPSPVTAQGQPVGLIGRSGAGKSALLRLLNPRERPHSGKVLANGQALTRLSKKELRVARQNLGMIFQQFNRLPNATVY